MLEFVETVSLEVPVPPGVRFSVVVFNDAVGPGAQIEADRDTGPAKLFRLLIVTRVVAEEPAGNDMLAGFAEIEKSGPTRTWRLRNLFPPPPLAVIVRL